ncbi:MAG TPA: RNA polymerase factor sigma-54, partial [Rhodanobacteraceae bacterium]|nr:RNA polymerase factor sigma-54 [Rhodanobacteraceae bacterium]
QAIRLLQLSNLELSTELRLITDANPLLMLDDLDDDPGLTSEDAAATETAANNDSNEGSDHDGEDFASDLGDAPLEFDSPYPQSTAGGDGEPNDDTSAAESLREHLLWQLNLSGLDLRQQAIGAALIDSLDDDGYLREPIDSILTALPAELTADAATVEAVRQRLLRMDPTGVGARDLAECLMAQLEILPPDTPGRALAQRLVEGEMELLARGDYDRLTRRLDTDIGQLEVAVALIRRLDPRPGDSFDSAPVEYVAPDAYAMRRNGRWRVSLSPDCQPRLEINQHYCGLMAEARREDAAYLRGQLQEARWLIKSLQSRAETILKVANAIVRAQHAFLEYGPEAMRPLTLREVAEEVGMHESTISRVTTRKYLHTPRGIFEFKYFFSSGVGTEDGGSASATAVQAMIRKLIDAENRRRPLSDQALAKELHERGIQVARRTVAKYRESLRIPSSSERVNLQE